MTGRSPMPPPSFRHPDRRQDILEEAHRAEIPESLWWFQKRTKRLESLLSLAAVHLDTADPDQDLLSEAIYRELSVRRRG